MPVSSIKKLHENTFLVLWKINESHEQLQSLIHERLQDRHTPPRKENIHWLASRAALLHIYPTESVDIIKDEFNKPHLKVNGRDSFISITHSFEKAAIMISSDRPVAIDLEKLDQRIERVKNKFCNHKELMFVETRQQQQQLLTIIWSTKESLYKYYGKKELDFRENLFVEPFELTGNSVQLMGTIEKDTYKVSLQIHVEIIGEYVMTYIL